MNQKIAFIGAGSMGGAIVRGFVKSGAVNPELLYVCDHHQEKLDALKQDCKADISCFIDAEEMLSHNVDMVILAVKPQVMPEVIVKHRQALAGKLVISIAAGITVEVLETLMPESKVVRVMPNLPITQLSGACAICAGPSSSCEDIALVETLFSALGVASVMNETQLDIEAAVVGCAPAYFALFIDALTRAAIKAGMPAAVSRNMLLSTMAGTAKTLLESGEHPRSYMDQVTSLGGTTAEALYEMEPLVMQAGFSGIEAALKRTEELS